MDGGVGCGREEGVGQNGWKSGVWERGGGRAGWMGEWGVGERRG